MSFTYKIHSMNIRLNYFYHSYYENNLEKYQTDDLLEPSHTISVYVSDFNKQFQGTRIKYNNTLVQVIDGIKHIYHLENDFIKAYVNHDLSMKRINIYLNPDYPYSLPRLEYIITGLYFLEIALFNGYFPFHATAIAVHDEVILITAASGTGKSTHARYWCELFEDMYIINDDKPLLNIKSGKIMAYGSPFSGEYRINQNTFLPVKAIIVLKQGNQNHIENYPKDQIIPMLVKASLVPNSYTTWEKVLTIIEEIYEYIPVYAFKAIHHKNAAKYLKDFLYGDVVINEN